ncbi:unnamed protein product [Brachionus calyciflorus]|uniref:long-chain-fatty-acid--CoA ligase n=1 Tax=Brachionus calyciflorus TaxID=104777 RepID=A0A814EYZ8_9BILA|nr:unnamed protein product [Brachionus calyciflorus]
MNSIETIQTRTSNYDWKNGPDQLCPADSTMSSQLSQPVRLRLTDLDKVKYPPISIFSMFQRTVKSKPDHDALAYKPTADSEWLKFSFEEYWKMCQKAAKSLIKLGLDTSQCVSILGFNSPQWFVSLLGTIFAGGVACGIYTTISAEQIEYILRDSGSKIIIVENKQLLDKVINYKDQLGLKKIIQYSGTIENNHGGFVMASGTTGMPKAAMISHDNITYLVRYMTDAANLKKFNERFISYLPLSRIAAQIWKEFMEIGSNVHDSDLDLRIKTLAPNKCASLIYTSGTTGMPKAAMISHDNITYLVRYMADAANLKKFNERFISYLPLSHIAAQIVDTYCPLFIGGTVYFAQPDALKGSLNTTLKQVRPTFFFGVPRVWEKIQEGIEKNVKTLSGVKLNMFKWAQKVATETVMQRFNGRNSMLNPSWKLAKVLILNKVHAQLGLDECRAVYSGAAPITKETLDFFISLGIPLCETYGMSESTGPHSVGTVFSNRVTSVGPLRQCNQSKLGNKDADGSGELLVKGRHVFMGYLNDINKTLQTFDSDEWLQTGDIAKINNNFIYITGRLKELIITAGGENIAPVPVEDNVKSELPDLISNCMLVGDKKKYLVILITLKSKMDLNTMTPLDELTSECVDFLRRLGSNSRNVNDIIDNKDPIVYKAIETAIKKANDKSVSRAAKVQKFSILPKDFSLVGGELGPTLKLRRPIVAKMYSQVIDSLYADSNSNE